MRKVTYHGRTVVFPDLPEYELFFSNLEEGKWDCELFRFIDGHTDEETVFIDVGGWIGVTPFWAAQKAKRVIIVEPDPVCVAILREMRDMNKGDITIYDAAVASSNTLRLGSVNGFGSSETSALTGDCHDAVVARGIPLDALISEAGKAPIFLKIDIEGYEYELIGQLSRLDRKQVRAISLAIHPVQYGSTLARMQRLQAATATFRLIYSLAGYRLRNKQALLSAARRLMKWKKRRQEDLQFVSRFS